MNTRFADIEILSYNVAGFDALPVKQKELIYYLSEAALCGRDILFDQHGELNLLLRRTLEAIFLHYQGDRDTKAFQALHTYLRRVWFSSGIHHHYGMEKMPIDCTPQDFNKMLRNTPLQVLPIYGSQTIENLYQQLYPYVFIPEVAAKQVNQKDGEDLVLTSACNYYGNGVDQQVASCYYSRMKAGQDECPSYGLNSILRRGKNNEFYEAVYKVDGLYSPAISRIIYWLEHAKNVAENQKQEEVISLLIKYYQTGDLKVFDQYSIAWVNDTDSYVDFINGFIETYGDPLGIKASWESLVNFKDKEATKRTETISQYAQWFEDHSPVNPDYKKDNVQGVSAKVITAAILSGDLYPHTAIGINLPNANWIRSKHGSKSVTLANITKAYHDASKGNGFLKEYVIDDDMLSAIETYGSITDDLHTDLHECVGHGSGKLLPGVSEDALKAHGATIEEARADLFALYFMSDKKMVELGLLPTDDAYKPAYYTYLMNGLMTQLVRIQLGAIIEESHMRNRQLIAQWVYEKGREQNVVELVKKEGKTYVQVNDYLALRELFGELLALVQHIKSRGDYGAARELVENYGVQVDTDIHKEVIDRYAALNIAPYKGFVNPKYTAVCSKEGVIQDVIVSYDEQYDEQMLRYSQQYGFLNDGYGSLLREEK